MFHSYFYEYQDPYNLNHKRNASNTDRFEYNCAGYALDTFSWYCPYDMDDCDELDELRDELTHYQFQVKITKGKEKDYNLKQCSDIRSNITEIYVRQMLFDFVGLRVITDFSEANRDERIILFRISEDGADFHYIWSNDGKQWQHKMGNSVIENYDEEYIFDDWLSPHFIYNGNIVIFALKI